MAGIYIHIPFCKSKCNYCNFYSVASSRYLKDFVPALIKEMELQKNYLGEETVETIYFGGGTPSLLEYDALVQIMEKLRKSFKLSADAEITIEANPDNLDHLKVELLKRTPVNRVSIGIQSFFDDDLKYLGRIHTASQAESSVKRCQDAGFENISMDLIYGIPTLSNEKWKDNLDFSFSLKVPHISAYSLTVEQGTALDTLIRKRKKIPLDEEQSAGQFKILMNQMKAENFIHYEISNFCKEGFISVHNSNYWRGIKYLGLGPSAHSYNEISRQWNVADIGKYLDAIEKGDIPAEKEILSASDKFNEYILTSLRTIWGCNLDTIGEKFGNEIQNSVRNKIEKHITSHHITLSDSVFTLTGEGKLFADGIAADLFE